MALNQKFSEIKSDLNGLHIVSSGKDVSVEDAGAQLGRYQGNWLVLTFKSHELAAMVRRDIGTVFSGRPIRDFLDLIGCYASTERGPVDRKVALFTPATTLLTCCSVNCGNIGKETIWGANRSVTGKSPVR
jgi:hypothetical protein